MEITGYVKSLVTREAVEKWAHQVRIGQTANQYIADILSQHKNTVSRAIGQLKKYNHIKLVIKRNSTGYERKIYPNLSYSQNETEVISKDDLTIDDNDVGYIQKDGHITRNITKKNTKTTTTDEKESRNRILLANNGEDENGREGRSEFTDLVKEIVSKWNRQCQLDKKHILCEVGKKEFAILSAMQKEKQELLSKYIDSIDCWLLDYCNLTTVSISLFTSTSRRFNELAQAYDHDHPKIFDLDGNLVEVSEN